MWQNLTKSYCDKTQIQIVTKLKYLNWDKTPKLKIWRNSKTWNVTKLKKNQIATQLKNSSFHKTCIHKIVKNFNPTWWIVLYPG